MNILIKTGLQDFGVKLPLGNTNPQNKFDIVFYGKGEGEIRKR